MSADLLLQPITLQLSPLRNNKSLCGPVGLRPLPADYQPVEETLPGVTADVSEQDVTSEEADDAYQSAEQLGAELVTLSLLPESRWKSLLHLDNIKVSLQSDLRPGPFTWRRRRRGLPGHFSGFHHVLQTSCDDGV